MRMRKSARKLVGFGVWLMSSSAWAGEEARLGVHFQSLVSGNDSPGIVLEPPEAVRSVTIKLQRKDGPGTTLSATSIGAGGRKILAVQQPVGEFAYGADFDATFANGEKSVFHMDFSLTRVDKLRLDLAREDVNLDARTVVFRINNPAKSATLELFGKAGKLATVQKEFGATPGGSPLSLSWQDPAEDLLYMDLKVTDVAGFWKGIRLTPFSVNIPHEEVVFETAKWEIRPSEEPKLKKTLGLIKEALDKHGKLIELRLYVAGYTDTVGSKESNRTLSFNRARAIASWFSQNGIRVPIFFQGFGEDVLAKPTPDETDEQANRRALYILSSQTPSVTTHLPKTNWSRL